MREILVMNQSTRLDGVAFVKLLHAIQGSLDAHFTPVWQVPVKLLLGTAPPDVRAPVSTRETVYILDNAAHGRLLGYHQVRTDGVPEAFALVDEQPLTVEEFGTTLDHEIKELIINPSARAGELCVIPHWWTDRAGETGLVMKEVCDPVEEDEYEFEGVRLANFIKPAWFQLNTGKGAYPFDFLGRLSYPLSVSTGGYYIISFDLGSYQEYGVRARRKHELSRLTRIRDLFAD